MPNDLADIGGGDTGIGDSGAGEIGPDKPGLREEAEKDGDGKPRPDELCERSGDMVRGSLGNPWAERGRRRPFCSAANLLEFKSGEGMESVVMIGLLIK